MNLGERLLLHINPTPTPLSPVECPNNSSSPGILKIPIKKLIFCPLKMTKSIMDLKTFLCPTVI